MPPIQQQQTSRGGLITALVITIVFAVGFLVWAFMSNADANKLQAALETQKNKYDNVIGAGSLGNLGELQAAANLDPDKPRAKVLMDAVADQRRSLVKTISGDPEATERKAMDEVNAALASIKASPALKDAAVPEGAGLTKVIAALVAKANSDKDALDKANASVAAANQQLKAAIATQQAEIAKRDQQVQEAQAAMNKAVADAKAAIDDKQKQVDEFSGKVQTTDKAMTDAQAQQQVETQTLQRQLADTKAQLAKVISQLAQFRPNTKESIIRAVDATITSTAPDNIVYVNLGYGDHVSPGMTFEVYDKFEGVPTLADGTSALDMPKGKGSVEIINVGQNSSQARLTTTTPGQTVSQGDLCVNIAYDRNIKPTFYVYGKFDMDQNGVATDAEAEVVKNLITRWGGQVVDKIGIDTDFVVFGKEPTLPVYTPEELNQPLPRQKFEEAKAALDAYNKARDEAVGLHIPVMNQNRFLYYTGYFEASKK